MGKKFMGLGGTDHFWDRAKAWILNQITSAVAAKIAEVVADAPEDLDTLKEIADWIKNHANDAAAMNTQITENKSNIAALSDDATAMNTQITENKSNIAALSDDASAMNTQIQTNKDNIATNTSDISALKTSVAGKADKVHTHSAGDITSGTLPIANGGTGVTTQADINKAFIGNLETGESDVTDGTEFVSSWATDNGFNEPEAVNTPYRRKFIKVWNYIKDKISSVLGLTKDNYGGKASTAGTADYARNMYYQNLDLSALDKTKFYPLVCASYANFAEVAICSESGVGSAEYNQNRIHFDISTMGWSDLPPTLNIREYACYENNEITIGCIGRGVHNGAWAIWLRGGIHYTCFSRDADLSLKTSDYTYGDETYTVGTNYYGGSNSNVSIWFTPQSTITEGAYNSRPITAPRIKADYRMVIPIGAPASLEDGCIWIER